jgi:histone-lysine N-methyltransferase SETD3
MNEFDKAIELILNYTLLTNSTDSDLDYLLNVVEKKKKDQGLMKEKFNSFPRYLDFINWLHRGDVYFAKLDIKFYSDDHRGVVSKQNISKDEIILTVPKDMLISIELAKSTELGKAIASFMYTDLSSPKHCLLSSFILQEQEKGDESKWKFYLDILPKDYSNFPIFFTDEELCLLEGSPFLQQIIEKKIDIRRDYDKICSIVYEFANYDYKNFCEVRMAVSSRIFGVKIDYKKTDVLAPYADLLNHKRPRQTHWFYDDKYKAFLIQSLEDIPQGCEVYDSYGKKCNSRFFLNYGFIVENNDANEYPLVVELDNLCPRFEDKKVLFKNEQECVKKFRISENMVDYQVIDLFSYLRFILFDGEMNTLYKVKIFYMIILIDN